MGRPARVGNVTRAWPGVTVRRILPTMDEVEGVTCLESQWVLLRAAVDPRAAPRAGPAAAAVTSGGDPSQGYSRRQSGCRMPPAKAD